MWTCVTSLQYLQLKKEKKRYVKRPSMYNIRIILMMMIMMIIMTIIIKEKTKLGKYILVSIIIIVM